MTESRIFRYLTVSVGVLFCTMMMAGCAAKKSASGDGSGKAAALPPTPVDVVPVKLGTISDTFPVSGSLVALQDVELSAKAIGRVAAVYGREGDTVRSGELIVQQDTTDLMANVNQARANILSARAGLSQAVSNYEIQVTSAKQGILQAQAQVEAARQAYVKEQKGSRPQQVLESQSTLLSAQATQDNSLATLNRDKSLYAQGALAKADLDTAQTNYDVAVAQFKNAQAELSLTVEGNQQEDILSALENLKQQKTNMANAIANEKLIAVKRDAIMAAQASIAQYQAALAFSDQQLANASITSPINGTIAARTTEPGQIANPGASLVRIVNLDTITFQPTISETDIDKLHQGTEVDVNVDALPGKTFRGYVAAVFPAADSASRDFTVRIALSNPGGFLKPGMFARGSVVTETHRNVPIVPSNVLVAESTQQGYTPNASSNMSITQGTLSPPQYVVVVGPGNKAHIQPVIIGIATPNRTEITSGLTPGELLVQIGQTTLNEGDKVAIQNQGTHRRKNGQSEANSGAPAAS